jgi:hypothetical protein
VNLRQAFLSLLHLFVVFAFFSLGAFFIALPHFPELNYELVDLLTHRIEECTQIGGAISILSLLIFLSFYALHKGRYLVIKMGVKVDLHLIRHAIEDLFARQFSKKLILRDLEMGSKNLLQIHVSLNALEEKQREELFCHAEKGLFALLRDRFGYAKPFYLVVKE